jgi:putative ABC transport system permease protein
MVDQMVRTAFDTRISHLHIFRQGYYADKTVDKTIPDGPELLDEVRGMPGVKSAVSRVKVMAMATSAAAGTGVMVTGVVPEDEMKVSRIHEMLREGVYFNTDRRNPAVIGEKLAQKLEVKLGAKVVLTAQMLNGDMTAGAFRVVGIFKTPSSVFDGSTVFVRKGDIAGLLGLGDQFHEIAVVMNSLDLVPDLAEKLRKMHPELEVMTWGKMAPDLEYSYELMDEFIYIFMAVILVALVFGIVNTMLMSVLERVRELGVLMAVGMTHGRIFLLVVLESVLLAMSGGLTGILIGAGSIALLERTGINLAVVSKGLASFGISEVLYPSMPLAEYPKLVALVVAVAVLSAIYPAIRAVKVNPVKAIRTYT